MKPDSVKSILLSECSSFDKNGFDTDIDMYVSLIDAKKYRQAASLYAKHLVPRYPDEQKRIRIIRYYRKRDIRFRDIYAGAVKEIFGRIVASVKILVSHLSGLFAGNNSNPYELLKKIETAMRLLPPGKEAGTGFLEKMEGYCILLDYMPQEFFRASDILKRYLDNTLFVKIEAAEKKEKKRGPGEKTAPAKKGMPGGKRKVTIDLDRVEFSDSDLAMICIDDRIRERAYQVLAYCRLYWRRIFNQDFEKKVFLYSKKYSTLHYRIFLVIKNCRIRKIGDDVILLEVYSMLSSGYRYSLREDSLMQDIWKKIKPVEEVSAQGRRAGLTAAGRDAGRSGGREADEARRLENDRQGAGAGRGREKAAGAGSAGTGGKKRNDAGKPGDRKRLRLIERKKGGAGIRKDALILSLAEKLDRLCAGDSFDAHNEFQKLLPKHIERYLSRHRKKESEKDPYVLKGAVYVISGFIRENYNTVSPDWKESIARTEVSNMGFIVPEIDTILATCLEEVRVRRAVA